MDDLRHDPALLASFRAGDRDTMGKVYDHYMPKLRDLFENGCVIPSTGARVPPLTSPDAVADALHQTFEIAFDPKVRLAYDGERDYGNYLLTIGRNMLISQHRKHGRELPSSGRAAYEDAEVIVGPRDRAPEPDQLEPWLHELIQQHLAALPARMQALHTARYVNDQSYEEVAAQLGVSPTRVHQLEEKLLRDLARVLKRAGYKP